MQTTTVATYQEALDVMDGREYTLDGIHGVIKVSRFNGMTSIYHHPSKRGMRTEAYRQERTKLGDDWSTDLAKANASARSPTTSGSSSSSTPPGRQDGALSGAVMTPAINVNLTRCGCGLVDRTPTYPPTPHQDHCPAKPVDIPLPLDAFRSVTFTVRLGECQCFHRGERNADPPPTWIHTDSCPARPIRVTCSITGKTWEESEATDVYEIQRNGAGYMTAVSDDDAPPEQWTACRDLWALVKALVTGQMFSPENPKHAPERHAALVRLRAQRDAVYAALCEMARAESTIIRGFAGIDKVFTNHSRLAFLGPSTQELVAYVAHLIQQVGDVS